MLNEEKSASGGEEQNTNNQTPPPPQTNPTPPTPPTPPKSGGFASKLPWIIIVLLLVLIVPLAGYVAMNELSKTMTPSPIPSPTPGVACTQEAKVCPDGVTSVGRTGPNCEFSPCPTASPSVDTTTWKTYQNTKHGYTLKYPNDFSIVKGPGENLPDEEFASSDNIGFGGIQREEDTNSGVSFSINVNPENKDGKIISCTTSEDCLEKWKSVLNITSNTTIISETINGLKFPGFEYEASNPLYTQHSIYLSHLRNKKFYLISFTLNNYSREELDETIDNILSTFKFTQ